jgi:hypothetical protein
VLALLLAALLTPVDGPVVRAFAGGPDPFAAGLRRGVVLRSAPGAAVRAPCGGRLTFAGRTPRGSAVTLRCRGRRVTVMPVAATIGRGTRVRRGAVVGRARGDVRLSVREGGAYVDPEPLLERPALGPPPSPVAAQRPRVPPPRAVPGAAPSAAPVPAMPWPAWAGAALLLAVAGSGVRLRVRSARARPAARMASDGR